MTDASIVAVDVAFLVPEPLRAALMALNATLEPPPGGFRFDPTHLPHVTLVQQFVRRDEVLQIGQAVAHELQAQMALELVTTDIRVSGVASTLGITLTEELADLHRRLLGRLAPFVWARGGPEAFWTEGDAAPRAADIEWVTNFRDRSALAVFDPHITLGVGAALLSESYRFVATELAFCQLGRFCTCRRVLATWTLPGGAPSYRQ